MINIIKKNDNISAYITEFVADTEADVQNLPTDLNKVYPGSTCIVVATSEVYMLNSSGAWVKL